MQIRNWDKTHGIGAVCSIAPHEANADAHSLIDSIARVNDQSRLWSKTYLSQYAVNIFCVKNPCVR